MSATGLDADEWRQVLARLAAELQHGASPKPLVVLVIGGVAMALAHDARRTTKDMDAVLPEREVEAVIAAADRIGAEFGLPNGWLNQKALEAGYIGRARIDDAPIVASWPALEVRAAPLEQLLATKLPIAFRTDTDTGAPPAGQAVDERPRRRLRLESGRRHRADGDARIRAS